MNNMTSIFYTKKCDIPTEHTSNMTKIKIQNKLSNVIIVCSLL